MSRNKRIDVESLIRHAVTLHQQGQIEQAAKLYQQALQSAPNHADALHLLGLTRLQQQRPQEAAQLIERAISGNREIALYHYNLGLALNALGDRDAAAEAYRRAIKLKPNYAQALDNLGNIELDLDRTEAALKQFEASLKYQPDGLIALRGLASAQWELGNLEAARLTCDRAISYHQDAGMRLRRALMLPAIIPDLETVDKERQRLAEELTQLKGEIIRLNDPLREVGICNFYLAYHGRSDRALQEQLAQLYLQACPELGWQAPGVTERQPGTRIRLGICSTFLHNHTVGRYIEGVVDELDRSRFELTLLFPSTSVDALHQQMVTSADHAVRLPGELDGARRTIAEQALDIILYADIGMHPLTYFLAFARLAPLQLAFYGHPVTTGIPSLDGYISHAGCEPEGAQAHYTERLLLLDKEASYTCYRRPELPSPMKSRNGFGLPDEGALYVCPQMPMKIHPDFDRLAAQLLKRDATGQLVLIAARPQWTAALQERLARSLGQDMERVHLLPRLGYADYLSLLATADLILDTPHFSGGASSLDAFAVGTPIVTLEGEYMRGRQTAMLCRHAGVPDLVANSTDAYVDLALRLAHNHDVRAQVRQRFAEGGERLFNDSAMVSGFADLLQSLVERID